MVGGNLGKLDESNLLAIFRIWGIRTTTVHHF